MSDNTIVETLDVQGLVVQIVQDPGPQNPEDMADAPVWLGHFHRQFWRAPKELPFTSGREFVAWYREYKGEQPEETDEQECGECLSAKAEALQEQWEVFIVRAYIHGGVSLALEGSVSHARMPDQQWDVSRCGVVLIDKKKWVEQLGVPTTPEGEPAQPNWRTIAEIHVQEWNQYLGGEVYGYRVLDGEERIDDSWGYYGIEAAREAARANAASCREIIQATKAEFSAFCSGLSEEQLDEMVHEVKSNEAAAINNSGKEAQVRFLLESGVERSHIETVAGTAREG